MKDKVNPIVGVIIAIVVVLVVGFASMKLFTGNGGQAAPQIAKPLNPDDPHFKPDPKLSGGPGQGGN